MVGELYHPDQAQMNLQRQIAAQALARQTTANMNADAARSEAERHAARGSFTTIPTPTGQFAIGRQNVLGYSAPTVNFRNLTPNGSPVRQAMSPSPAFQPNIIINGQQQQYPTSRVDTSRIFLSGRR